MIVYEYVSKITLEEQLHGENPKAGKLQWETRLNIACNVAETLAYLHFSVSPPTCHRDVKSGNILVNEEMKARLQFLGFRAWFPWMRRMSRQGCRGRQGM
ncbi:hypothetical protein GOP47_0011868 [Adiantum capillus-veneris]|uniref:Protein kinase domain-containing protein n=1 Tax=Adiantum capillus-veneris TaxID=13818 RepID=A0A9D4ZI31_ADICA|nr:hypothetical protein GOP47_0011868 [Adiantum capillus-veneris]